MSKNPTDYNPIITAINEFLKLWQSDSNIENTEELNQITSNCVKALAKIFEECLAYGNFKDNWQYDSYNYHISGPALTINSLKTKCDYSLGINEDGLYLSCDLGFNENLRYMDDNFWKLLLGLSEINGFEYVEHEFVSKETVKEFPDLFKTNKSMIYRIMRKYFFDATDKDSVFRHGSVGEFIIVSEFEEDFTQTVRKFSQAFKMMYKLNYDLWKVSDLKNKKSNQNFKIKIIN